MYSSVGRKFKEKSYKSHVIEAPLELGLHFRHPFVESTNGVLYSIPTCKDVL